MPPSQILLPVHTSEGSTEVATDETAESATVGDVGVLFLPFPLLDGGGGGDGGLHGGRGVLSGKEDRGEVRTQDVHERFG